MVQLKVLVLVVVGIISLNSCNAIKDSNYMTSNCDKIIFYNSNDKILIEKNEYNIINNNVGFELVILDSLKLKKLTEIINPSVEFCIENKKQIAKGNNIFSSKVPLDSKYFFPLNENNNITLFKGNILSFKKV